jgi:hypothetical protein
MNMKNRIFVLTIATVLLAGCAMGGHHMSSSGGGMDMKTGKGMMAQMDTNGDGMLSKDEFMKGHEAAFERMKGKNGMISIKDMPMH